MSEASKRDAHKQPPERPPKPTVKSIVERVIRCTHCDRTGHTADRCWKGRSRMTGGMPCDRDVEKAHRCRICFNFGHYEQYCPTAEYTARTQANRAYEIEMMRVMAPYRQRQHDHPRVGRDSGERSNSQRREARHPTMGDQRERGHEHRARDDDAGHRSRRDASNKRGKRSAHGYPSVMHKKAKTAEGERHTLEDGEEMDISPLLAPGGSEAIRGAETTQQTGGGAESNDDGFERKRLSPTGDDAEMDWGSHGGDQENHPWQSMDERFTWLGEVRDDAIVILDSALERALDAAGRPGTSGQYPHHQSRDPRQQAQADYRGRRRSSMSKSPEPARRVYKEEPGQQYDEGPVDEPLNWGENHEQDAPLNLGENHEQGAPLNLGENPEQGAPLNLGENHGQGGSHRSFPNNRDGAARARRAQQKEDRRQWLADQRHNYQHDVRTQHNRIGAVERMRRREEKKAWQEQRQQPPQ